MCDAELLNRAAAGNEEAFGNLIERFQAKVRSKIRRSGVHANDVDDVFNEFLCKLWRDIHIVSRLLREQTHSNLEALIVTRAFQASVTHWRRRGNVMPWSAQTKRPERPSGALKRIPRSAVNEGRVGEVAFETNDHAADVEINDEARYFLRVLDPKSGSIVAGRLRGETFASLAATHGYAHGQQARKTYEQAIKVMRRHATTDGAVGHEVTMLASGVVRRRGVLDHAFVRPGFPSSCMILAAMGDADSISEVKGWTHQRVSYMTRIVNDTIQKLGLKLLEDHTGFRDLNTDVVIQRQSLAPTPSRTVIHSIHFFGILHRELPKK